MAAWWYTRLAPPLFGPQSRTVVAALAACLLLGVPSIWFALGGTRDRTSMGRSQAMKRPIELAAVANTHLPPGSWSTWVWECNTTLRYAHMSMLVSLPAGRLAAAWQTGAGHEGEALAALGRVQALHYSLSRDGGASWSAPVIAVRGMAPVWGPVLHYDARTRRLWIFYSVSSLVDSPGGDVVYRTTSDVDAEAPAWSPPTVIWRSEDMEGLPKVTANRLEVLEDGTWVLPVWQEAPGLHLGVSSVLIGRPDDAAPDGRVFSVSGHLHDDAAGWLIEGSVAEVRHGSPPPHGPPRLLQLFRTKDTHVWTSESRDRGATWLPPRRVAALRNPNSKVAVTRVVDEGGRHGLVLAYNPAIDARAPLVLAYSRDGTEWTRFATLETDDRVPGQWYAYPTVVQHGRHVFCSYTVYDHLRDGEVMGVVRSGWRVDVCPDGAELCAVEAVNAAGRHSEAPTTKDRLLKNRFLGIKMAVVPVPSFRDST